MQQPVPYLRYLNSTYLNSLFSYEMSVFFARTEERVPPDCINGPKIRDCYLMFYVHAGRGVIKINNNSFEISAGQCFMTFPNALVTQIPDKNDPWAKTWVGLKGAMIPYYLKMIGITEESPVFPWKSQPEVLEELLSYLDILKKTNPFFEFDQRICANKLFKLIFKSCNHELPHASQTQEQYVQRAIEYIENNCNRKITVNDIATHVGLNRTYLSTLFKAHTNQTPQEFLLKLRIDKACEFLTNPNSTVASVADSLGYEPCVFTRLFKRTTGMSPIQYKNSIMNRDKNQG